LAAKVERANSCSSDAWIFWSDCSLVKSTTSRMQRLEWSGIRSMVTIVSQIRQSSSGICVSEGRGPCERRCRLTRDARRFSVGAELAAAQDPSASLPGETAKLSPSEGSRMGGIVGCGSSSSSSSSSSSASSHEFWMWVGGSGRRSEALGCTSCGEGGGADVLAPPVATGVGTGRAPGALLERLSRKIALPERVTLTGTLFGSLDREIVLGGE